MQLSQKKELVFSINKKLQEADSVIIAHYQGLSVDEITSLRKKLRELGAEFRVTKNSLIKLAIVGTNYAKLDSLLQGPTAIAFSKDPVSAAKGIVQFANLNEKLVVLGGMVNEQMLDVVGVKSLATLPSLDELRAKIIGVISAPAAKIASVLKAPAGQLTRVISAHAKAGE